MKEIKISEEDTKGGKKTVFSFTVDSGFSKKFDRYLKFRSEKHGLEITKSGLIRRIFMSFFDENPGEFEEMNKHEMSKVTKIDLGFPKEKNVAAGIQQDETKLF